MTSTVEHKNCRLCGGTLKEVLDLGNIYPSTFITEEDSSHLERKPLVAAQCRECGLVQLKHTVDLDSMYRQYWYRSETNPSMIASLQDIADNILKRVDLSERMGGGKNTIAVLDIGANDGTLLKMMPRNLFKVGFDPALNLGRSVKNRCDLFINDYFTYESFAENVLPIYQGKFKVITSIAMFYDLPDPHKFVSDVAQILDEDGIWVLQLNDLKSIISGNDFVSLCHEHLEYYTLRILVDLFYTHNLDVFDVQFNDVNGGSVRLYVCHKDRKRIKNSVVYALKEEKEFFDNPNNSMEEFSTRIRELQRRTVRFLEYATNNGKKIYGVGASTKGNTLLQVYRINEQLIKAIAEVNEDKFGKRTVGSNIPIISEEELEELKADYLFILPYHFRDFFVKRFRNYIDNGGTLIFPLPTLSFVGETQ